MAVEEYANGAGGLLPRLVDDAGIRQVPVDRVLRLAGRRDDEAGGDAAYERLEGCASRDGVGLGFGCRMKRERPGRRSFAKGSRRSVGSRAGATRLSHVRTKSVRLRPETNDGPIISYRLDHRDRQHFALARVRF